MSRNQHKDTDTLSGKQLRFKRQDPTGETDNVIKDITLWESWERYLESKKTKGFYVEDEGISFGRTYRTLSNGTRARYWHAIKRVDGRLYRVYAGRSEDLTLEKIIDKCEQLQAKIKTEIRGDRND